MIRAWLQHRSTRAATVAWATLLHNLAASLAAIGRDREVHALLQSAISHQRTALLQAPENGEAKSHLLQHYSHLLRCQIRSGQWRAAEVTSADYQAAAAGNPQELMKVAIDLAEAAKRTPQGRQRDRSISAAAAALGSARDAGLKLEPSLLTREPFLALARTPLAKGAPTMMISRQQSIQCRRLQIERLERRCLLNADFFGLDLGLDRIRVTDRSQRGHDVVDRWSEDRRDDRHRASRRDHGNHNPLAVRDRPPRQARTNQLALRTSCATMT